LEYISQDIYYKDATTISLTR